MMHLFDWKKKACVDCWTLDALGGRSFAVVEEEGRGYRALTQAQICSELKNTSVNERRFILIRWNSFLLTLKLAASRYVLSTSFAIDWEAAYALA